jgi:hypothetical protein
VDKILRELKDLREEIEERFRALLESLDAEGTRLRGEMKRAGDQLEKLCKDDKIVLSEQQELLGRLLAVNEGCLGLCERLSEGLREMMALDNARSAELARQVTALPFERMDLIADELERRLEALEAGIQRIEKKSGK